MPILNGFMIMDNHLSNSISKLQLPKMLLNYLILGLKEWVLGHKIIKNLIALNLTKNNFSSLNY